MIALLAAVPAFAQEAGVELKVETRTLELQETVAAQLVCTNIGQPGTPGLTAPEGLDLRLANPNPSQSSFTSIVNGRMSQRTTYTYALRLTGLKEGTYTVGPITIEAEGATYQTLPVTITVRDTGEASQPDGDKLAFVRVEAAPTSLYVTESLEATLTIGIRKVYIQEQKFDYEDLLQTIDASASDFSVFGYKFSAGETSLTDSAGKRHEYMVYRQRQEVRAEEVGDIRVGPVFLKINYPTAFRREFFGGVAPSRTQRVTARADAVFVSVKGPPEEGRPGDFTGAIGRYTLRASIAPTRVEQGRPVTLTIVIEGQPIEAVAGPDLRRQAELASRFEYAGDELTGDVEGDSRKVFRRAIFPKQQGEQSIPPISWSYFDPRSERYVTLSSEPLALGVDPPAAGTATAKPFEEISARDGGVELTVLRGGISPNYVDAEEVLVSQSVVLAGPSTAAALGVPPILYCVVVLAARYRARLRGDAAFARRRRALRAGCKRIARAVGEVDAGGKMCGLSEALTTYLSDRFDLPPGELTPAEVRELLIRRGQDEGTAREIADFLSSCDALRYAPGAAGSISSDRAAGKVRDWMYAIERGGR